MTIKFIDLFAGIGGFRYGLESAETQEERVWKEDTETIRNGKNKSEVKRHERLGGGRPTSQQHIRRASNRQFTCVYSNEWDKYAAQIYDKNFGNQVGREQSREERKYKRNNVHTKSIGEKTYRSDGIDTRDIRTVVSSEIPDFDLLVGGFPCQAFSIAGKRKGFDDTRGTLFFEIARILADKRPRYFILENVKGLLSHDEGKTFQTILGVLSDLGYDYQWQVLNSKNFGVPQNRERVFIIGHLRGTPRPKVFPVGKNGCGTFESEQSISGKICTQDQKRQDGEHSPGESLEDGKNGQLHYIGGIVGKRDKWLKDGKDNSRNFSQGQRVYGTKGISSTLAGNAGGLGGKTGLYEIEKMKIRRLTPTECERLQGFPDGWTESISDTQRYKCLGNAVTTNVVEWIGRQLIKQD